MSITTSNGANFQYRTNTSSPSDNAPRIAGITAPEWIKLVRAGNLFTGYVSSNGAAWTQVGSASIPMTNQIYAGMAVCARDNTLINTSAFNNVSLIVPVPPGVPASLMAIPGNGQVALNWTASGGAASYSIKRSTASTGPFTSVANASGLSYTNTGLINGTVYYFVVSATNAFGESANSLLASARPVSTAMPQLTLGTSAGLLQLNWPLDHTGWRLQAQTNSPGSGLGTNWVTVFGSPLTNQVLIPVNSTNGSAFFRLVYP